MANSHTALRVSIEEDLLPLSTLLYQRGVPHRIFEEGGRQVLKVQSEEQAAQVQALYRAWREGQVTIELSGKPPIIPLRPSVHWRSAPVTMLLILASVAGFLLVFFNLLSLVALLTYTPVEITSRGLLFGDMGGQYWRLVTPAFLHFHWLHIAFNCLWLWELGVRVERVMGSLNMIGLFLVIAVVSNASQFLFGGPGLFGGMSGVVYGLLGFCWVGPHLQPRWQIQPPAPILWLMVGWLVVCMAGVVEAMGLGRVANAAHLGGLLCGAALGAAFGLLSRLGETRD